MFSKVAVLLLLATAVCAQILPEFRRIRPGPIIQTSVGRIQGQEETYGVLQRINTYKGIRYAQAPVGNLRFRQGVAPLPYQNLFQAWQYGSVCPQFNDIENRFVGIEDCLFLNIATPTGTNSRSRLPVVVNVHGGALQIGNGEFSTFGPEFLNEDDVIYVSFNYRLGVLGFLNTGDQHSPGNYALKDMIMALQWVQNNILAFGKET